MTTYSHITWPRSKVAITDDDADWLARAVFGETGSDPRAQAAVAWSMAQRLVYFIDQGHTTMPCRGDVPPGMTFKNLIRCFSQPTSAYWLEHGTEAQKARRRMIQTSPLSELERRRPGLLAFVDDFVRGKVPNPVPRLADFSAPDLGDVPRGSVVIGGNAFFAEGASAHWPDDYVRIVPASGLPGAAKLAGGVAIGALVAWAISRWLT